MAEIDREQLATVLDQIADFSTPDDIRAHLRIVTEAIRGSGLVIMNGPVQQAITGGRPEPPPAYPRETIQVRSNYDPESATTPGGTT